jgi:hypothetical protein
MYATGNEYARLNFDRIDEQAAEDLWRESRLSELEAIEIESWTHPTADQLAIALRDTLPADCELLAALWDADKAVQVALLLNKLLVGQARQEAAMRLEVEARQRPWNRHTKLWDEP